MLIRSGIEGSVFGPFHEKSLKPIFHLPRGRYILKIYFEKEQVRKKKYQIPNKSIIFPIDMIHMTGEELSRFITWDKLDPSTIYSVEAQEFGGIDLYDFLHDSNPISFSDFCRIWQSICEIIVDTWHLISKRKMFISDVKMQNMVWNGRRLRLIDINTNDDKELIYTPSIINMPAQFLGAPLLGQQKLAPHFKQLSDKYYDPKHPMYSLLFKIHHEFSSLDQVIARFKSSRLPLNNLRFFFVVYPLFMMILIMMEEKKIHLSNPRQHSVMESIRNLCFDTIYTRGKNTIKISTFIRQCTDLSCSKKKRENK